MQPVKVMLAAITLLVVSAGCAGGGEDVAQDFDTLDLSVCSPANGPFTIAIDNQWHPLPVGLHLHLEGDDDGTFVEVDIDVLDETETVAGVETRVVTETEYEDGELIEVSRNFFAQAPDGTVCYFGEDVDDYENGEIVGHEGQWRAGEGENLPGILMPGTPTVATKFPQEDAPGIAEDWSAIVGTGETITVPAGTYENTVHALDWNPLEGDTSADGEDKYYAPGIGLVVDDVIELTTSTIP